ncbi:hypothetical protein [Desulfomonile tiedjei]|uniref:Uncharacterized protein n=1 Tax=Desulfomonile tiedjei (strain ATCC 49306 / DSM 6799 / DCB-1) TaxID=706587 RepID=I4C8P8_DESTA|nr:hypothetical protein [Desulfomonile tiedjei]AFM25939.1 hypothetical protein Desti_3281 [Desulfomonile tiedjei DSM 6799]
MPITLDDSVAEFIEKDPEFLSKLDEVHDRLETGHRIFLLREKLKMSRKRFGEVLGLSEKDVLKLEYGDFTDPPRDVYRNVYIKINQWLGFMREHGSKSPVFEDSAMSCKTAS